MDSLASVSCQQTICGQRKEVRFSTQLQTMFGGPRKPLAECSNREIIIAIIVFVIVGSFIIVATLSTALPGGNLFTDIWGIGGAAFVATIVGGSVWSGATELRRRRKRMTQNQEHRPPT